MKHTEIKMKDTAKNKKNTSKMKNISRKPGTRGRWPGDKLDGPTVQLNRYNLMFYQVVMGETASGKPKVIGRDYSIHRAELEKRIRKFSTASDTFKVKFLKACKRFTWKEDILRLCPNLFKTYEIDIAMAPIGTAYQEDRILISSEHSIAFITDVPATRRRLEEANQNVSSQLISEGYLDLSAGLIERWSQLQWWHETHSPPTKPSPHEIEAKLLKQFSWDSPTKLQTNLIDTIEAMKNESPLPAVTKEEQSVMVKAADPTATLTTEERASLALGVMKKMSVMDDVQSAAAKLGSKPKRRRKRVSKPKT